MQERQRRLLYEHVVVVGGAAHECGQSGHGVADLEPDALLEEALRLFLVGGAEHDVAELAGTDRMLAQDAGGSLPGAGVHAGGVVGRGRGGTLGVAPGDLDQHSDLSAGVDRAHTPFGALDRHVKHGQRGRDPVQVVRVVGTDAQLQQPAASTVHDAQLFAAVGGGEGVVGGWRGGCRVDERDLFLGAGGEGPSPRKVDTRFDCYAAGRSVAAVVVFS